MTNPSQPLRVILVGTIPGARPATCDPALDLDARPAETTDAAGNVTKGPTVAELLTRYERERTDAARDALPVKPGMRPTLFEVQPLTPAAWRWVLQADGEERAQRAFLVSCHKFTDAQGHEHKASVTQVGRIALASDEWLDEAWAYGAAAVREIAKVALDRAEAGPSALAPFALPRTLTLPR